MNINKKVIIIPALSLTVLGASLFVAQDIKADTTNGQFPPVIQKLVDKFGLNQDEVAQVMEDFRSEQQQQRQQEMMNRLNEAVEAGEITTDQKKAILAKHEEMIKHRGQHDDWGDLTPEERQAQAEQHHQEMEAWAKENGIDWELMMKFGGPADKGMGQGVHRNMRAE